MNVLYCLETLPQICSIFLTFYFLLVFFELNSKLHSLFYLPFVKNAAIPFLKIHSLVHEPVFIN